jgi:hypothetical protein
MNKWSKKNSDDPFGTFNLSEFKKWMSQQKDSGRKTMVGLEVESKIPYKKLLSRIETQDGELVEVAKCFKKNGGVITEENGHYIFVEVDNGSFMIHRMHLKMAGD